MMRWLLLLTIFVATVLASPVFQDAEALDFQYQREMAERRSNERFLSNAQRLKRGLPLNKPHVRSTKTMAPRAIASPSPRAAIIAVYRDSARTNLVGYVGYNPNSSPPSFPVTTVAASAITLTLPNQGSSSDNTINTGISARPFYASAYGTSAQPAAGTTVNRYVHTGNNYITFYPSASTDGGSPQTMVSGAIAAETSNWDIPEGTYGPITYSFVDADGIKSSPNFYYKSVVSNNLRAALNPTTASQSPRLSGNVYNTGDQVYLSWAVPVPAPP